jgi:CubicO group peptidase (beta-lactamase class C family)
LLLSLGASPAPPPAQSLEVTAPAVVAGKFGKIAAIAIEQHGALVYRRRFIAGESGEPVDIRSAGKSLTALAVGAAIADGKLAGVQVQVWPYLGDRRGGGYEAITVRDLLTMSSPLACDDGNRKSPGQEERMYRTRDWTRFALAIPLEPSYLRDAQGFGRFSYCTAGVFLLGRVVEKATGEPFDHYVQRRLLGPLGVRTVQWRRSPSGEVQAGGQLGIGDADLLKIGRMVLDRGRWHGAEVVPGAWIGQMLHPWRQPGQYVHYGYLWWAMPVRSPRGFEPSWMMQGNGGNLVALLRDYDAVAVIQAQNYNKRDSDRWSHLLLQSALASLPPPVPVTQPTAR